MLSAEQIDSYNENGFLHIPEVFVPDERFPYISRSGIAGPQ